MIRAAIYDTATGTIFQISQADSLGAVRKACGPGQDAIDVPEEVSDATHRIVDETAVALARMLPSSAALAAAARQRRNQLLAVSDWTQLQDAPVDRAAWAAYRAALRELPEREGFPVETTWPEAPALDAGLFPGYRAVR